MVSNTPIESIVTIDSDTRDGLVRDIWNLILAENIQSYDPKTFKTLFSEVWKSYHLQGQGFREYKEVVRLEIQTHFLKRSGSGIIGDQVMYMTQGILDGEENTRPWTDKEIARIMNSFNYSRADAINMLNGAYHHEMINKFATAAADDY